MYVSASECFDQHMIVWHDSFTFATRLIYTCDVTHSYTLRASKNVFCSCVGDFVSISTCKEHLTYVKESCHVRMSHVTKINEMCHTCEWDISTRINESCRTYRYCQVSLKNESNLRYAKRELSHIQNESCHTYEQNIFLPACSTHEGVMSHIWMSHVTHTNESCRTYEWVMSHIWLIESYCTYEWVMSHTWMSHIAHMNESCCINGCVMSPIRMSHAADMNRTHSYCHTAHTNESCRKHE